MINKIYFVLLVGLVALYAAGCCNTKAHVKQTQDNVHALALDGEVYDMPKGEEDVTR